MSDQLDLNALSDQHGTDLKKLVKDKLKRKKDVLEVETEAETESDSSMDAPIDLVALLKERLEKSDTAPHRDGTSPSLKTRSSRTTADLEKKPKSDLYARAKKLGIDGRSTMNKKDLVSAIKKAAG